MRNKYIISTQFLEEDHIKAFEPSNQNTTKTMHRMRKKKLFSIRTEDKDKKFQAELDKADAIILRKTIGDPAFMIYIANIRNQVIAALEKEELRLFGVVNPHNVLPTVAPKLIASNQNISTITSRKIF